MDEASGETRGEPDGAGSALPAGVRATLRAGYADGIARYGDLALPFERYAADVVALVYSARAAMGLETTELQLAAAVAKRALPDLYLARACEHGSKAAWRVLVTHFQDRLAGLAVRKGARGANAEQRASALIGDLALTPAKGEGRTRIGAFAGLGALWPWLASQLVRGVWREREKVARTDAADDRLVATSEDARPARSAPRPVWSEAVSREAGDALERAIADAWDAVPERARTTFVLKHRHRMPQRRIAALLGVGEPAVSRALGRVVDAIRAAASQHAALGADAPARGEPAWDELKARLASVVARLAAAGPPLTGALAEEVERMRRG